MGFINEILEKNLFYIKKYDLELCKKVEAIDALSSDIQMIYTDSGEPNLAVNGVPVSLQSGAQAEAEAKVKAFSHNGTSSIHIVFGTGFGYIFKQASEFSKGTVILYEPNLELLRVMLEMVDLSDVLSRPRVFVVNDLNMLEKHFCSSFMSGSRSALTFTAYHKNCLKSEFNSLLKKLGVLQGMMETNENQRLKMGLSYAKDVIQNLPLLSKCNSINKLKDSLKGMPAVIAAAGPSLGENLEIIKKYREKFVLFSVSTSYKSLVQNGINPDFISMIERFDASNFVKDYNPQNVCLIAEPYVNSSALRENFKNKFITCSVENSANKIYEKACRISHEDFETKGTVAYNALFAAKMAGCNPIILVGQDLAYIDGECYSKNSPLSDFKCRKTDSGWQVYVENAERLKKNLYGHIKNENEAVFDAEIKRKVEELNKQLVTVKSISGQEIATSLTFALFSEYYKQFSKKYSADVKLYTVSKKGADIGDFEYMPLEEILSGCENIDKTNLSKVFNFTAEVKSCREFLETELEILTRIKQDLDCCQPDFTYLVEAVQNEKLDPKAVLAIKKLLSEYLRIQNEYASKSIIFNEITMCSKAAMTAVFEKLKDVDYKSALVLQDALNTFYKTDYGRIEYIKNILISVKKEIENETGCSAG